MLKTSDKLLEGKIIHLIFLPYIINIKNISRYLQDWREKGCLKLDELSVLFSNIQDIYEFNSSLLEQLIESKADPSIISKCFIDAYELFDVYTTYW